MLELVSGSGVEWRQRLQSQDACDQRVTRVSHQNTVTQVQVMSLPKWLHLGHFACKVVIKEDELCCSGGCMTVGKGTEVLRTVISYFWSLLSCEVFAG